MSGDAKRKAAYTDLGGAGISGSYGRARIAPPGIPHAAPAGQAESPIPVPLPAKPRRVKKSRPPTGEGGAAGQGGHPPEP